MLPNLADPRHKRWQSIETAGIICALAALMLTVVWLSIFFMGDIARMPTLGTVTIIVCFGALIFWLISIILMSIAAVVKQVTKAQISRESR